MCLAAAKPNAMPVRQVIASRQPAPGPHLYHPPDKDLTLPTEDEAIIRRALPTGTRADRTDSSRHWQIHMAATASPLSLRHRVGRRTRNQMGKGARGPDNGPSPTKQSIAASRKRHRNRTGRHRAPRCASGARSERIIRVRRQRPHRELSGNKRSESSISEILTLVRSRMSMISVTTDAHSRPPDPSTNAARSCTRLAGVREASHG